MARPRSNIPERLRAAASVRFLKEGVDGASLRAIASDARTNIGMLYYYYPSKDDLFFAVVEDVYGKVSADLADALKPELPVAMRVERAYQRIASLSDQEIQVLRLVICEILKGTERLDQLLDRFQRGHLGLMARVVADGLADGTFDRNRHPLLVLMALMGLGGLPQVIRRFAGARLPFRDALAGAALSLELVDVLLHGVAAHGS
ncbi:MAG TPA: TetR/AcrR family transcriptional regulator [Polyangiaceae bacterium]|jgi:AcrR family transcriptional regulator